MYLHEDEQNHHMKITIMSHETISTIFQLEIRPVYYRLKSNITLYCQMFETLFCIKYQTIRLFLSFVTKEKRAYFYIDIYYLSINTKEIYQL